MPDSNVAPREEHVWNAVFFVLFPIEIILLYTLLGRTVGVQAFFTLNIFDILIIAFGVFRVIRLVVYDKIFSFFRVLFLDRTPDGTAVKPARGFRRAVAELIECPWCVGVWIAATMPVLYVIDPLGRFFVIILAIAALANFFQVISRRIGGGQSSHSSEAHVCS